MALHVRGVVLPDDEVRDLWLVGDRVTDEAGARCADRQRPAGSSCPGWSTRTATSASPRARRPITSLDEARALASIDREAGVLAIRDAGSPYPYPELDDDPDMPRLARAGQHVAPVAPLSARHRRRGRRRRMSPAAVAAQAKAGNGWVKLVGDWIDREVGDLAPAWDRDDTRRRGRRPRTQPGHG